MKDESEMRNHGGGLMEESWRKTLLRRNQGGGQDKVMEEEPWSGRDLLEDSWRRKHGEAPLEEKSWETNHGEGIMEKKSWRRNHRKEEKSWRRKKSAAWCRRKRPDLHQLHSLHPNSLQA